MKLSMEHLRLLRKELGYSQAELGEILGTSGATIGGYETGRRAPDMELVLKMSEFFNVSVDYLLGQTETRVPPGTVIGVTPRQADLLDGIDSVPEEIRGNFEAILLWFKKNKT